MKYDKNKQENSNKKESPEIDSLSKDKPKEVGIQSKEDLKKKEQPLTD